MEWAHRLRASILSSSADRDPFLEATFVPTPPPGPAPKPVRAQSFEMWIEKTAKLLKENGR